MTDTAFRKIDVDQYDEDVLVEGELYEADPRDPQTVLNDTKAKNQQVRSALSKGDAVGALNVILEGAPYGPDVNEAKALTLSSILLVLNSTKATDITAIVRGLSQDQQDTLMKFLYKGMASLGAADVNGSVLLAWHEKLTEVAGVGCIVRVITDRRTV